MALDSPIPDYLADILDYVHDKDGGAVADYIPELKDADPDKLALAVCTANGRLYSVGDDEVEFSIQSISKPFVYALALDQAGEDAVSQVVGVEPSGEAFNELSLEEESKRPDNAMINAGAIAINQLINGTDSSIDSRADRILQLFSDLAGRKLRIDEELTDSELAGADRNLSIAYMLRNYGIVKDSAEDVIRSYTRQCSVMVTTRDLAVMAATLANGGVQPVTGERIFSSRAARHALAVMSSAGMYDAAGRWMYTVGIPAKSGVAGGLIGTMPGQMGIATFSPRLDEQGNSVRGVQAFEQMSEQMDLHLMGAANYAPPGIRSIEREGDATLITLQGVINFTAAENVLYEISQHRLTSDQLVLDISEVASFNKIGRRVVKEGLRRLRENGAHVAIYDPDDVMADKEYSDGTHAEKVDDFELTVSIDARADEVYNAIVQPSTWWADAIEGDPSEEGEIFELNLPENYAQYRVVTAEPGQRVVWHVEQTGHADEVSEWTGSDLVFELEEVEEDGEVFTRLNFTHRGLQQHKVLYEEGSNDWTGRLREALPALITEGKSR
ncbi:glutaminase [Corynebacterium pilosum]|uniref:Glutaminase n=1 Tax=Corynebacterium pilosum TaxID=35756 RepID=A0A376CLK9_9CORY|nr:glutaminase [Corynebacterium pilosum]